MDEPQSRVDCASEDRKLNPYISMKQNDYVFVGNACHLVDTTSWHSSAFPLKKVCDRGRITVYVCLLVPFFGCSVFVVVLCLLSTRLDRANEQALAKFVQDRCCIISTIRGNRQEKEKFWGTIGSLVQQWCSTVWLVPSFYEIFKQVRAGCHHFPRLLKLLVSG